MATVDDYIDLRGLSFKYPDGTLAVKDINLTLSKGEYVVVMGPNGAGKTTLSLFLTELSRPLREEQSRVRFE